MKRSPFSNSLSRIGSALRGIPVWVWVVPLVLIGPALLPGRALYFGTVSLQFHPWRVQAWRTLLSGELPLWNPLSGMGAPLLANYQSALLYPPTWLLFVFGALGGEPAMAYGQGWVVVLHLVLAGWGMARLVRALGLPAFSQVLSGLAFGCSGYLVARSHFLSINAAVAWLPWVLLFVYRLAAAEPAERRRPAVRLALVLALLLLAGHAQTAWYTLLLAGAWLLFWTFQPRVIAHSHRSPGNVADNPAENSVHSVRSLVKVLPYFAAALAVAILIAAAQLLPTAELLSQSPRTGGVDEAFAMTYSFWPWRLPGLFVPGLFGSPATGDYWGYGNYWEDAVYIGLVPVVLALQAVGRHFRGGERRRLVRFLAAVSLVSFALALGSNTPLFPFLYRNVPTFDQFQAPARFTIWAVFSLALLAGIGAADWAAAQSSFARQRARRWSAAGIAVILAGAAALIFLPQIPATFGRAALVAGVFGCAAALFGTARKKGARWRTAVAAVTALDLVVAGWGLNPAADLDLYREKSPPVALAEGGRVYLPEADIYSLTFDDYYRFDAFTADLDGLRGTLLPNLNLLDGIPSANQFDPLEVARYTDWIGVVDSARPELKGSMLSESVVSAVGSHTGGGGVVFQEIESAPRAEWYLCAVVVDGPVEAIHEVLTGGSASEPLLALEMAENRDVSVCGDGLAPGGAIEVEIVRARSNALWVQTAADQPGWLLIRDTYYPGWVVTVDGEGDFISPANALFRAVPVPAGEHIVEMRYRPVSFYAGILLSAIGLAAVLFASRKRPEAAQ